MLRTIVRNDDGNRNVPYCNQDGKRWNGNWNWLDTSFNENGRVAVARKWRKRSFQRRPGGRPRGEALPEPSAEHSPDFVELFGEANIFLRIERLDLPENLQKELEEIELCRRFLDVNGFLRFPHIARNEDRFARLKKEHVDLGAEGIAGILGNMWDTVVP